VRAPRQSRLTNMTLAETLLSVWQQVLVEESSVVALDGQRYTVGRTRGRDLRLVDFSYGGHPVTGIEQNPETKSRWASLAQQGQRVMQFSSGRRYFANVAEGRLVRYSAWTALALPD
jgi:hypothetical protein